LIKRLPVFCIAVASLAVAASAADPHIGTWKINDQKSNYGQNDPPREETAVISEDAGSYHVAINIIANNGEKLSVEITFPLQGGAAKVILGGRPMDSSVEVPNPNTWIMTLLVNKQAAGKNIYTIIGKELHLKDIVTNADGTDEVNAERVFDLQK